MSDLRDCVVGRANYTRKQPAIGFTTTWAGIEGKTEMIVKHKIEFLIAYATITTTLVVANLVAFASGLWWY